MSHIDFLESTMSHVSDPLCFLVEHVKHVKLLACFQPMSHGTELHVPCKDYESVQCDFKPLTDDARNLLAIDLRLDVRNYCDGLQPEFQHPEYFTCNSLITQAIVIGFLNGFHYYSQEIISFPMIAHTI